MLSQALTTPTLRIKNKKNLFDIFGVCVGSFILAEILQLQVWLVVYSIIVRVEKRPRWSVFHLKSKLTPGPQDALQMGKEG